MLDSVTHLSEAIVAVCPIDGVSSDGRIDFKPEATIEQRTAAQAIVAAWDWVDDSKNIFSKEQAKAAISSSRYTHEVGGIVIGTQFISSDRDEIGHWFPRFANAQSWLGNDPATIAFNPTGMYPYKPKGGNPTSLTALQVVRAYMCLSWFVNACFATEQYLYGLIDATDGSKAQLDAVMGAIQWPQREFTWEAPT